MPFPKPKPPCCCCWKEPPLGDGAFGEVGEFGEVAGGLDAGVGDWVEVVEVLPTTCPATRPLSIPKATKEPAISHFLHVSTNASASALDRRGEADLTMC